MGVGSAGDLEWEMGAPMTSNGSWENLLGTPIQMGAPVPLIHLTRAGSAQDIGGSWERPGCKWSFSFQS